MSPRFSADRYVIRARRLADLSQRDLADLLGVARSVVSRMETGQVVPSCDLLSRILGVAGLQLVVVDAAGAVVDPVAEDVARDNAGRRYPAHLDVHPVEMAPSEYHWRPRHERQTPKAWFQLREERDRRRAKAQHGQQQHGQDHPTVTDLEKWRAQVLREKAERARRRAAEIAALHPPLPECCCHDDCYVSPGCVAECTCQCEPQEAGLG